VSPFVALVADAGEDVGLGHLARGSAIAAALAARGVAVACHGLGAEAALTLDGVRWEPLADVAAVAAARPAAVVLDSYRLDDAGALAAAPLVAFVDGPEAPDATALALTTGPPPPGPAALAGLAYAPLRRAFWGLPRAHPRASVERVLVSTGGGDVGDAAARATAAVRRALPDATVALVRGPQAREPAPEGVELVVGATSLLEELERADLLVAAAGQTSLEAAAVGTPSVVAPVVENQRANAAALRAAGAAVVVEELNRELEHTLVALAGDAGARADLSERAQAAVDGYGALRIAFAVERLAAARQATLGAA
jgi:spore coat polysaccharide biosynthesis predicted glycosyltransferase SpsG